jgi:hypothetical protein
MSRISTTSLNRCGTTWIADFSAASSAVAIKASSGSGAESLCSGAASNSCRICRTLTLRKPLGFDGVERATAVAAFHLADAAQETRARTLRRSDALGRASA